MTRNEAIEANVRTTEAVVDLTDSDTHLVHVSTAYVNGNPGNQEGSDFGPYRNAYEWSKAECELLVRDRHSGPMTIVRPPLILGRRTDGSISRFTGSYTILQALVSGLAAAVIGDPQGFAEVAPVDQVADVISAAATGPFPAVPRVETIAGGADCMRLLTFLDIACGTLNEWRAQRGIAPIAVPPFISTQSWHRFFLPLAKEHLSQIQYQAIRLLGMFENYTSMTEPFEPTRPVKDPVGILARSVRKWADSRPRLAARLPEPWTKITE